MNTPPKLIILDRDGVINVDSAQFIKSTAEWKPIPGSIEAIARLNQAGYRVVVCTNQSGIGRGLFDMRDLQAGVKVGCTPILVLTGKGKKTKEAGGLPKGTKVFADLAEAVRHLVAEPAGPKAA